MALFFSVGFMIHTFMDFSITNDFKISLGLFGVSEARLGLIILNVVLIIVGKGLLIAAFPFFVGALLISLCITVYRSQIIYAHIDAIQQGMNDPASTITPISFHH